MSDPMVKEVRLGLVCYGGVSLAIYMHGQTKELFKLVRAARAVDRALEDGDFDPDKYFRKGAAPGDLPECDSEPAYFAALKALADAGKPVTVAVDIISGTSAGGINGVCLARALAGGRSLDGIRQLWLDEGDMEDLLAGHALFPFGSARLLTKMGDSLARLVRHPREGLLNGNLMCQLLYEALDGMKHVEDPLVRADESLDLFVTTTNVHGYQTVIPSGAGGVSHTDKSYQQLMRFSYQQEPSPEAKRFETDFSNVPALAFAARATASFPGAFPPVSLGSFLEAVDRDAAAGQEESSDSAAAREHIAQHFVYDPDYSPAVKDQWFMDGGVLDNGPFDHVIDAIAAKRADGPTVREIIYLEPDPGVMIRQHLADKDGEPTFVGTVWASRITIPWHTSLARVLGELESMNAAIAEAGALVNAQEPGVLRQLKTAESALAALTGKVTYDSVTQSAEKVRAVARELAGDFGYSTYCRLRAQALAESFGMTVAAELRFPSASNRTNFIVAVLCAWARQQDSWAAADTKPLEAQLDPVDVPFRLRRAEFVLQGINDLFNRPGNDINADLVAMKKACWDLICELRAKQQKVASMVHDQAKALFGPRALREDTCLADPDSFARAREQDLSRLYEVCRQAVTQTGVKGTSQDLWETLVDRTHGWDSEEARTSLRARYVGFPIWDSLIFPVISLAKLPQLTPITVHRFSPLDATCLHAVQSDGTARENPSAKLDGVALGHFGAFFKRPWRENDYLWGRLDSAELILRLLTRESGADLDLTEHLRSALTAILDAEHADLSHIEPVWQALKAQVADLKAGCMTSSQGQKPRR